MESSDAAKRCAKKGKTQAAVIASSGSKPESKATSPQNRNNRGSSAVAAGVDPEARAQSRRVGKRKLEAEESKSQPVGGPAVLPLESGAAKKKKKPKSSAYRELAGVWEEWVKAPPPTISMHTSLPCSVPANWCTEEGAKLAADCREDMDVCRLIGTMTFQFEIPTGIAKIMSKLSADVQPSRRDVKLNNMTEMGVATWNGDGEPGSQDCFTIKRLLNAVEANEIIPRDDSCEELLEALHDIIKPDAKGLPWKPQPLLRVICPQVASSISGNTLIIKAFVYIRRLIFFLIAYPPLSTILRHVDPAASVRPTVSLPAVEPAIFTSHTAHETGGAPADYAYSLPGIMKSQEHPGYRRAEQPAGLKLRMKDYQLQTLQWMLDREGLEHGLNSLFWEERQFVDGGTFYYAPALGELRLEAPSKVRGGILSEEMGLGKTIEILALVLASKQQRAARAQLSDPAPENGGGAFENGGTASTNGGSLAAGSGWHEDSEAEVGRGHVEKKRSGKPSKAQRRKQLSLATRGGPEQAVPALVRGGTLVVVPVHLVAQWCAEIDKTVGGPDAALTYVKYTADDKLSGRCARSVGAPKECEGRECPGTQGHLEERTRQLVGSADIVVTTYGMLAADHATFARVQWERIVLDEMQEIRRSTSELARACQKLPSQCRWMVSGTPLYSSIDDLNGELSFLGVQPFCLHDSVDGFWGLRVSRPLAAHRPEALRLLDTLLGGVMIRHSKSQTYTDGTSILSLPPSSVRQVAVPGLPEEDNVYAFLEAHAVDDLVNDLPANGACLERGLALSRVQVWLRVLLEACLAPSLLIGGAGCVSRLRELDQRLRQMAARHPLGDIVHLLDKSSEDTATELRAVRAMTAAEAVGVLMQARAVSETARHQRDNHMVRHDAKEQGVYDRTRNYAMPAIDAQIKEVSGTKEELEGRLRQYKRNVPLLRWKWAVECVSSGRYFDLADPFAPYPRVFMRKLFAHLRLQREHDAADGMLSLKAGPAHFQGQLFTDKAKLRTALERSVPVGLRIATWKATSDWTGGEDLMVELPVSEGTVVHAAASTEQGHHVLGFSMPTGAVTMLAGIAEVEERVSDAVDEMDSELVASNAAAVLSGNCSSVRSRARFQIQGRIGLVPLSVLEPQACPRNANLREKLRDRIGELVREGRAAANKLADLDPFLVILKRTMENNPDKTAAEAVMQSGFQQLFEIEQGASPTCCVCQSGCGYEQQPTFMRCAHFACFDCLATWIRYQRSRDGSARLPRQNATCPLCRKAFETKDLIRITPPEKEADAPGDEAGCSVKDMEKQAAQGGAASAAPDGMGWCPAATMQEVQNIGQRYRQPRGPSHPSHAQFPSLPVWVARTLAALGGDDIGARPAEGGARVRLSGKVQRLLSDLGEVVGGGEKAVVFSQHKASLNHISHLLSLPARLPHALQAVKHVKIAKGDPQTSQEAAVGRFNSDPDVAVFLLHAGQGAAGLTLTKATHVFLLEPFFSPGEELQAMNRCHRIGQDRPVSCTVYYRPGTIEQRVLAHRRHDGQGQEREDSQEGTDALSVLEAGTALQQVTKLRFLLGIAPTARSADFN